MSCFIGRRSRMAVALSCPIFGFAACLVSLGVAAQTAPSNQSLPPVVVTASRLPQSLPGALPHTTVLTARDIAASGATDLLTLLKRESGVELTQNGGMGSTSSLFMRGSEARHLLVLVDGVRLNSETLGSTAVDQILLDQVERIEIVRGNVSALYGSGAIGGVVQIFTKSGAGRNATEVSVKAGSRGTSALSAAYAEKAEMLSLALQAGHFRTQGFSAADTRIYERDNPDRDGFSNDSLSGRLAVQAAQDHQFGLAFYGVRGQVDFDNGGNFGAPGDVHEAVNRLTSISLFSDHRFSNSWTSHLQLSTSRDHGASTMNGGFYGAFDTRHRQAQWRNEWVLHPSHTMTFAAEADRQSILADSGFGPALTKARTVSAWSIGYVGQAGAHDWQINARRDRAADFGTAHTGLLGYGFSFAEGFKWIVLGSSAFTAPNLGQLYSPGFGNPDLQAERAKSLETGLSVTRAGDVLRLTAFKTRVRQQIGFDLTRFVYQNDERVRNEGVEVSYSGRVRGTDLRVSLTHQNPKDERTGQRLSRRAATFGSFSATRDWAGWTLGTDVYSSAARLDGSVTLGGYALIDLRLERALSKQWAVRAKLENVADKRYQTAYGYNQAPRGLFVSLTWRP